jgi:hypothetical protein
VLTLLLLACSGDGDSAGSTSTVALTEPAQQVPPPDEFRDRRQLRSCGEFAGGNGYSDAELERISCFTEAFDAGDQVELVEHHPNDLGESYLRVLGPQLAEYYLHIVKDPQGEPGWVHWTNCRSVEFFVRSPRLTGCSDDTP